MQAQGGAQMNPALKPRMVSTVKMKHDATRGTDVLLLPERIVKLNKSAAAILSLCDGSRSVSEIQQHLCSEFGTSNVKDDVVNFLGRLVNQGWVKLDGD